MTFIPRLNQTCTVYDTTIDSYGDRTKKRLALNVPCRFFEKSGRIQNPRGEDIYFDASLHIEACPVMQKGMIICINQRDYQVVRAGHTRNLNGDLIMQFLRVKEVYAAT